MTDQFQANGFQKDGEEVVYKSWFTFSKANFVAPDGTKFMREIIHHPGAVSIVPLDDDGDTVYLVRQFRASVGVELLEIPAGKRDVEGEAPIDTGHRELAEEVGKKAGRMDQLCEMLNSPGFSDESQTIYLARDLSDVDKSAQGIEEEHMKIETVRLSDVEQLIASGMVRDAKTITGLLLARQFIASEK